MEATTALTAAQPAPMGALMRLSDEQVGLITRTVAKGASRDELALFLQLAETYGLDPFAKEIWCIKYGTSPATIFTSRDGYLKIANANGAFDGIVSDVVHARDEYQVGTGTVEHRYAQGDRGPITGAYALVFRKDRRFPAYAFAPFAEYNAGKNPTWKNYPSAMILKVAEAMALKRAFSISGLVTREELDVARQDSEAPAEAHVVREDRPARQLAPAPMPAPRTAYQALWFERAQPKGVNQDVFAAAVALAKQAWADEEESLCVLAGWIAEGDTKNADDVLQFQPLAEG